MKDQLDIIQSINQKINTANEGMLSLKVDIFDRFSRFEKELATKADFESEEYLSKQKRLLDLNEAFDEQIQKNIDEVA